jgi:hypothetical protein
VSLSFTKWPASGSYGLLRLRIYITNTAYTVTLPAAATQGIIGIQGLSGSTITFAATGYYEFGFSSVDGGTTITVFDLNRPLSYYTNPVTIASTANSTSTTTGALKVAGGVGIVGNLYVGGDIFGNVSVTDLTLGNVSASGYISATGNITGGNVTTAGLMSATGNITGGNVTTAGLMSATGNITGGNVTTAGLMSATGNITGGNLNAVNLVINRISSDDSSFVNIEDGINVTGAIDVSGNITGGNLNAAGLSLSGNVVSAINTTSAITTTANITGGNLNTTGTVLAQSATAIPTGGAVGAGYVFSATANFGIFFGSGVPTLSAAQGSLYLRSDGTTTNDRMYVNTDGTTIWTAVITAA